MSTLLINNRRYTCEPWELMSWDKLHAILRYDEQRHRSDRQSVDRLTAELLTKIAGVRRPLAYRTDPDDRADGLTDLFQRALEVFVRLVAPVFGIRFGRCVRIPAGRCRSRNAHRRVLFHRNGI